MWVSVWSEADETVVPTDSARLEGALNLTVQSLLPGRARRRTALCRPTRSCSLS